MSKLINENMLIDVLVQRVKTYTENKTSECENEMKFYAYECGSIVALLNAHRYRTEVKPLLRARGW